MRTLVLSILIAILTFSFVATSVEAKRFGGGKSFGMSRQYNRGAYTPPVQNAAKSASGASKWLGPLAGLAIGTVLGSMLFGHGFGSGLLTWIILGAVIFFIWRLIRNRVYPPQNSHNANFQPHATNNLSGSSLPPYLANPSSSERTIEHIPNFDEETFLREAKALFIRLQAAYDSKNLTDIREFTSPQVFAEVQLQLQERGNFENRTEVVNINDEIIDRSDDGKVISVLFTGLIREEQNSAPIEIREIWHLQKNEFANNWVVAGIQQD